MLKIAFSPANVPAQGALVLTVAADQKLGPHTARSWTRNSAAR